MPGNQPPVPIRSELQSLLAFWLVAAGARGMPRRADLRIAALEPWWDNIAMIVPAACGELRRWQFTYCGEALAARFGRDMMRRPLARVAEPLRLPLRALLKELRWKVSPTLVRSDVPQGDGTFVTRSDLVLPLSSNRDGLPDRMVFASYPDASSPADAGEVARAPAPQEEKGPPPPCGEVEKSWSVAERFFGWGPRVTTATPHPKNARAFFDLPARGRSDAD
ncbi:MAG: hypothetical protein ACREHE_02405 [Rhizomicrobium sp.]